MAEADAINTNSKNVLNVVKFVYDENSDGKMQTMRAVIREKQCAAYINICS